MYIQSFHKCIHYEYNYVLVIVRQTGDHACIYVQMTLVCAICYIKFIIILLFPFSDTAPMGHHILCYPHLCYRLYLYLANKH